ncbi:taurine transporter substrate binding subunit [Escherichia coli]|uniref:Taurine transporter substrate binding subunit n=1 Tax=Escherichia coli TaxID=562 RepID=A0AAX2KFU3_ECOLX|nr:taurine transporter substrate binding subunit [Escherichia coli]
MAISSRNTLLAALAFIAFQAQAVNVTVAYQTSAEPAKVAQADNTFAKESVDWRKFDSGASIVRALASGDVQIGNLGSSPLAVAASQQVPIEVFLLASKLGNSEALGGKENYQQTGRSDWQTHRRTVYLHHPLQPAGGAETLGH